MLKNSNYKRIFACMKHSVKKVKEYISEQQYLSKWLDIIKYITGSEEVKLALAKKIRDMARHLSFMQNIDSYVTLLMAIVIRAYVKHNYLIKDCQAVITYVIARKEMLQDMYVLYDDGEAEFVATMAEQISALQL